MTTNVLSAAPGQHRHDEGKLIAAARVGFSIPDHELIRCIGVGSYGEVWLARNLMGAYRAIKIVYRRKFSDERPFERELSGIRKFEPISRLHEGFVDVLHVGQNETEGCFYYVMELGDDESSGQEIDPASYSPRTLVKAIGRNRHLEVADCVQFGIALAHALAELHKHGLVHRDIKPSNIIFVNGVPKLADIGLVAEAGQTGSFVGTEGFIPPEGPGSVQADIYGLGKVLYEAATGKDRHNFPDLPPEFDRLPDHATLLELNTVILDACRPDRTERYQSAAEMHADLVVIANGNSVKRLRTLERRWAVLKQSPGFAALVILAGAILAYPIYGEWKNRFEERQRKVGADIAYGNRAMDAGDLLGALPYFTDALRLDEGSVQRESDHRLRVGSVLSQCPKLTYFALTGQRINHAQFSPDGKNLLLAMAMGNAEIRQVGKPGGYLRPFGSALGIATASYSADGRTVATAGINGSACLWDSTTLQLLKKFSHPDRVYSANLSPDGHLLVTACRDGLIRLWDVQTETVRSIDHHGGRLFFANFSPDGQLIVSGAADSTVRLWSVRTGEPLGEPLIHLKWVSGAAFSADGAQLITACDDHKARIWDVKTQRQIYPDLNHRDVVKSAEFSPDGRRIVTASLDGTVRLWRADTHQPIRFSSILRHGERVIHASFSPDGRCIVTSCLDGAVRIWDLAGRTVAPHTDHRLFSEDKTHCVSVTNGFLQVQETIPKKSAPALLKAPKNLVKAELNANGKFLITWQGPDQGGQPSEYKLQVWNAEASRFPGPAIVLSTDMSKATLSDDGARLIVYGGENAQIWDVRTGKALSSILRHSTNVESAFFSRAGDKVGTCAGDLVQVWDSRTGQASFPPLQHSALVHHAEFSPDGTKIVTCCSDPQLTKCYAQVWDVKTGTRSGPALNHNDGVLFATFSSDGRLIGTTSEDFTALAWDAATSRAVTAPLVHDDQVQSVSFSSDSKRLLTASIDKSMRIWSTDRGSPLTPPFVHIGPLFSARLIDDEHHIVSTGEKGQSWIWEVPSEKRPVQDLVDLASLMAAGAIAPSDTFQSIPVRSQAAIWERLKAKHPASFTVTASEISAWHAYQAEECEATGEKNAAKFHLRFLGDNF